MGEWQVWEEVGRRVRGREGGRARVHPPAAHSRAPAAGQGSQPRQTAPDGDLGLDATRDTRSFPSIVPRLMQNPAGQGERGHSGGDRSHPGPSTGAVHPGQVPAGHQAPPVALLCHRGLGRPCPSRGVPRPTTSGPLALSGVAHPALWGELPGVCIWLTSPGHPEFSSLTVMRRVLRECKSI